MPRDEPTRIQLTDHVEALRAELLKVEEARRIASDGWRAAEDRFRELRRESRAWMLELDHMREWVHDLLQEET